MRTSIACLASLILISGPVWAMTIYPAGAFVWVAVCNDGTVFGGWPSPGYAMVEGAMQCESHGGVAEITEQGLDAALEPATCGGPSGVKIGEFDGQSLVRILTSAEFQQILDQAGGVPQELAGLRLLSVVVHGVELLPAPPQTGPTIPLTAFYTDDDDDGDFVGGATGCSIPPVPNGTLGTPMRASRSDPSGSMIDLTWDISGCPAPGYHVLFGSLANVDLLQVDGGVCSVDPVGGTTWTSVPPDDLWFLVAGDDRGVVEGSWGRSSDGSPRLGGIASGVCGLQQRDDSATCP